MRIEENYGDVLTSEAELVLHQVNCQATMNSGIAKTIKDRYPRVYAKYQEACDNGTGKLGKIQVVDTNNEGVPFKIVNFYSQENYGYDGQRYTSYDALDTCFASLRKYVDEHAIHRIALPYKMSCVRGGGDWNVFLAILKAHFDDCFNVVFETWKL